MLITLLYGNAPLLFRFCSNMLKISLSFRHCKIRHKSDTLQTICRNHMDGKNADWMIVTTNHPKPLDDFCLLLDKIYPISGFFISQTIQTLSNLWILLSKRHKKSGWTLSESIH